VGIENNTDRNRKDLREMLRSAKALKRNNWESKVILNWPLNGPSFFLVRRFRHRNSSHYSKSVVGFGPNFAARMASRQSEQTAVS
jgi:hypothetical protein